MDNDSQGKPNLVSPLVDDGHVDVVDEDGHLLAGGRAVGGAHALVHVALHRSLEGERASEHSGREGDSTVNTHLFGFG